MWGDSEGVGRGDLVKRDLLFYSQEDTNQAPSSTDSPIRVKFGPLNTTDQRVTLATDGLITVNVGGVYDYRVTLQLARTGTGGVAWLYVRVLVNGVQAFGSALSKLATQNLH
jgi:hypothetical protein